MDTNIVLSVIPFASLVVVIGSAAVIRYLFKRNEPIAIKQADSEKVERYATSEV